MPRIVEIWSRLRAVFRRRTLEEGLDEEIRFHIDQQTEKNLRAGLAPAEARRQALIRFGAREGIREQARDEIRPALLQDLWRDLQYATRVLRHAPGFTLAALLTLALGIGATAAIFSVVRTVMLEPLPYRDPERIVTIWETNRGGTSRNVIAPANYMAWRERVRSMEQLGMVGPTSVAITIDGRALDVSGLNVSADVFQTLGVQPALGRAYSIEEDFSGAATVMLVSHEFWQRRLAGRSDILGLTLSTSDGPRTVIGVMPPRFTVVGQNADFLRPFGQTPDQLRTVPGRDSAYAIARLRDGVSFDQAYGEMKTLFAELEKEEPRRNARRTVMMFSLQDQMVGELRPAIFALMGAVVLVLLVACVNVANLLLARSAAREREVAMRRALGAGRGRLIRQLLTESLVLAFAGGVGGLAVAAWCHRGLLLLVGDQIPIPRLDQIALDPPVVAFTLITALASGLLFGLLPAFISTAQARDALRTGGRHGGGRRLQRMLASLVVAEVALSLVLVVGAGLLMRSVVKLRSVDLGFQSERVLTVGVTLPRARYDTANAGALFASALSRIAAMPGVRDAAGASCLPVPFACIGTSFWRVDQPRPADGALASGQIRPVTPAFFRTMGIAQIAGRDFAESDTVESAPVAIVSEELVRQQFPDGNPLGRRLRANFEHANGRTDMEWTIVGVVGNTRSTLDGPVRQTIYVPRTQRPGTGMTLFVRTEQDPLSVAPSIAGVVRAMEAEAPVDVRTLDDVIGASIARPRAISLLLGVFALVALALAAVGVYGVMAYSVRERTQEIGVRIALGATSGSVLRLILSQALRLVAIGVVIGLGAAALLAQLLDRLLYQVAPLDPVTFGVTAAVLLTVAALASYVPAARAMRMAPVDALRRS